jgi:hypothetical protein
MNKKEAERQAFFDFYKQNAEPTEEKVYATPEAYKAAHQEEQNKHIKESVEAAVKDLEETVYEGITIEPRPLPTEKDNPFNGANCLRCKWLDKTRTYKWYSIEFYVCKRKELIHKAEERKDGEPGYKDYVRASDLQTDGYLNGYAWKCENKDIDENLKPYLNELDFD